MSLLRFFNVTELADNFCPYVRVSWIQVCEGKFRLEATIGMRRSRDEAEQGSCNFNFVVAWALFVTVCHDADEKRTMQMRWDWSRSRQKGERELRVTQEMGEALAVFHRHRLTVSDRIEHNGGRE